MLVKQRHDTQHIDTQHNYTQHNDTQHNDTQHNNTQHNDTQPKELLCDTRHKLQSAWMTLSITMLCYYDEVMMVNVTFDLLLC
jgi:hypothetical protein